MASYTHQNDKLCTPRWYRYGELHTPNWHMYGEPYTPRGYKYGELYTPSNLQTMKIRHICLISWSYTFLLDSFALPLSPVYFAFPHSVWNPLDNTNSPIRSLTHGTLSRTHSVNQLYIWPQIFSKHVSSWQSGARARVCVWIDSSLIARPRFLYNLRLGMMIGLGAL